ncbi:MAG TPA: hypothetical protein VF331_11095 [Polyangiales bacterium]
MSASYYDVVVLGSDLAPLTCGALLAKRGFRVLVLGQNEPSPSYEVGPYTLPRRPFQCAFGRSPVGKRIFPELGLGQSVRRITQTADPAFQVALPGHRFDVCQDDADLAREMEREFPEVKRPIDDFHKLVGRVDQNLDALLERDLVLPPETFMERQRFSRVRKTLDLPRGDSEEDVLGEFPEDHPFRVATHLPARFESDIDPEHLSPLRLLRLYSNCRRGALTMGGGLPGLRELLIQKIKAHSGQVRLDERASELLVQRGQVTGVQLFGAGEEISCGFVVVGIDVAPMLRLLPDRAVFEVLLERIGEPLLRHYRYTLNVVIRSEGLPPGMAHSLYLVRPPNAGRVGNELRVRTEAMGAGHTLLSLETLLPSRKVEDDETFLRGLRPALLSGLRELVPFLDRHLLLVDSPHDGLPPEGTHTALDIATATRRGPQTMPAVYSYPVVSTLGLCALPVRTPIKHLLFCNAQVVPGLGSEGQLLAASSAARVITWTERGKAWMRRRLWTKVEI